MSPPVLTRPRAARPTRLATIPLGYGDGLLRSASNRGHVLIRGVRCPIVGNVAMDLTTVDVSQVPGASIGDEADMDDIAEAINKIQRWYS